MKYIPECPGRAAYGENILAAAQSGFDKEAFTNANVLITGATGLVGGALARTILCADRLFGLNTHILCPVRDISRAREALKGIIERPEAQVFEADITKPLEIEQNVDYIVHCAGITASKQLVTMSVEVIRTAVESTTALMELAKAKHIKGAVYLSSMEAFGIPDPALERVSEKDLGYIDLMAVRSCYGESKRLCENLCRCYAAEYLVPVRSARLAQTFAAGVNPTEKRVFMSLALSALRGENAVLHTKGESTGNYVHIADCVSALIQLLTKGENGDVYTVCADEPALKIKQLAYLTCELLSGGRSKVVFDIPEDLKSLGFAPDVCMVLSNKKLRELGWQPHFTVKDMIVSLGRDIKELGLA